MYPLRRVDDRVLPADYEGIVVTCDVDQTYLETDFRSVRGLLTIPLEWAEDKLSVAGMAPVLRGLRFGPSGRNAQVPFYFLTASPPFMRGVLTKKMLIDRIQYDGITFKDWEGIVLKRRKPVWLKRQLAYKLCALLHQRRFLPKGAGEVLIGDDEESDAVAYVLYADAVAGRIDVGELDRILKNEGCDVAERREAWSALSKLPGPRDAVRRIYIYLTKGTNPKAFSKFGAGLVACRSPFQMAAHMATDGLVPTDAVVETARELIARGKADGNALAEELRDGLRRGLFKLSPTKKLHTDLATAGLLPPKIPFPKAVKALAPRPVGEGPWFPA